MGMLIEFLERFCREWRDERAGRNADSLRFARLIDRIEKLEARVQELEKENTPCKTS